VEQTKGWLSYRVARVVEPYDRALHDRWPIAATYFMRWGFSDLEHLAWLPDGEVIHDPEKPERLYSHIPTPIRSAIAKAAGRRAKWCTRCATTGPPGSNAGRFDTNTLRRASAVTRSATTTRLVSHPSIWPI
jgi:hypothetical protein